MPAYFLINPKQKRFVWIAELTGVVLLTAAAFIVYAVIREGLVLSVGMAVAVLAVLVLFLVNKIPALRIPETETPENDDTAGRKK
jgi:apolipoprotein N-acyltransferase